MKKQPLQTLSLQAVSNASNKGKGKNSSTKAGGGGRGGRGGGGGLGGKAGAMKLKKNSASDANSKSGLFKKKQPFATIVEEAEEEQKKEADGVGQKAGNLAKTARKSASNSAVAATASSAAVGVVPKKDSTNRYDCHGNGADSDSSFLDRLFLGWKLKTSSPSLSPGGMGAGEGPLMYDDGGGGGGGAALVSSTPAAINATSVTAISMDLSPILPPSNISDKLKKDILDDGIGNIGHDESYGFDDNLVLDLLLNDSSSGDPSQYGAALGDHNYCFDQPKPAHHHHLVLNRILQPHHDSANGNNNSILASMQTDETALIASVFDTDEFFIVRDEPTRNNPNVQYGAAATDNAASKVSSPPSPPRATIDSHHPPSSCLGYDADHDGGDKYSEEDEELDRDYYDNDNDDEDDLYIMYKLQTPPITHRQQRRLKFVTGAAAAADAADSVTAVISSTDRLDSHSSSNTSSFSSARRATSSTALGLDNSLVAATTESKSSSSTENTSLHTHKKLQGRLQHVRKQLHHHRRLDAIDAAESGGGGGGRHCVSNSVSTATHTMRSKNKKTFTVKNQMKYEPHGAAMLKKKDRKGLSSLFYANGMDNAAASGAVVLKMTTAPAETRSLSTVSASTTSDVVAASKRSVVKSKKKASAAANVKRLAFTQSTHGSSGNSGLSKSSAFSSTSSSAFGSKRRHATAASRKKDKRELVMQTITARLVNNNRKDSFTHQDKDAMFSGGGGGDEQAEESDDFVGDVAMACHVNYLPLKFRVGHSLPSTWDSATVVATNSSSLPRVVAVANVDGHEHDVGTDGNPHIRQNDDDTCWI